VNWDAIAAIAQVIGSGAVVVTLLYLTVQIRQNTKQLRLTTLNEITGATDRAFDPIYIPENTKIWHKGHSAPEDLTENEWATFSLLMTRLISNFQNLVLQHKNDVFDHETYRGYVQFNRGMVTTPGGAKWYVENKGFWIGAVRDALESDI
jgi:hypothetical protein